jgi:hypothetical protein
MRLYKKAAACLLTAAMAISMLTACGGGGTGGNGGGNTPGTLPDNSGQIVLPDIDEGEGGGEGGGEGTGTKPTKTPIIDVNNSKLVQFSKKYAGATEFYVEMKEVSYGKDGSVVRSIDGRAARKGENCYVSMATLGKNNKQQLIETLMLKNKSTWDQYLLFRSSKAAVKSRSEDDIDLSLGVLIANKLPTQMWSTEIKVGPTKYYAEVYKYYSYEYTTCFTEDGKPVYQFVRDLNEKQLESATLYKTIQVGSGTSKGLCALPSGTKTYSFDDNTGTLIDANGNKFTLQEDATTGIKVLDKDGKDVTDDFKWLTDFFEMMS